jgi:hypothetical protein
MMALNYYTRFRFIINLKPLLENATSLRRVVFVAVGGKEGKVYLSDMQGWNVPIWSARRHIASLITLGLEMVHKEMPSVSLIHDFPPASGTSSLDGVKGTVPTIARTVFRVIGPLVFNPLEEVGEKHLFLATSAKYPPKNTNGNKAEGVPLLADDHVARGTKGESASGVYSVLSNGESAGSRVDKVLAELRASKTDDKAWSDTLDQYKRICGN